MFSWKCTLNLKVLHLDLRKLYTFNLMSVFISRKVCTLQTTAAHTVESS